MRLAAPGKVHEQHQLAGRLILVCEDEPLIALDIANAFTHAGARVATARSLRDALIAVEDGTLSAAILDHALGDGDSSELCERLKKRNIPFVLYSGFGDLGGACGEAVHVPKPGTPELLVTTMEGLLRRRPTLHLKL
jgi:DNA-binding response OmpR family regulator